MWDYEKIGNEMVMKMMLIDGVREPTLTEIQYESDEDIYEDKNLRTIPAWKYYSEPHPGIPEHYHTVNFYNNISMATSENDNDLQLPRFPFSMVNREIKCKLLISLKESQREMPSLKKLSNGSIIIASSNFPMDIKHDVEIFLKLHEKLLPCCFTTSTDDIIIDSPLTAGSRVRCYYLVTPLVVTEAILIRSNSRVICRCEYEEAWFHGSTSYQQFSEVGIEESD